MSTTDLLHPSDLSPLQRAAMLHMLNQKVGCLSSDCGFGKSICGLTAFRAVLRRYPDSKMLVVCTPEGTKKTWPKEILKWSHLKDLTLVKLVGTPAQRLKKLQQEADIYVISYGSLGWLKEVNKKGINFIFVYADEGDCLKGPTSAYRKNLKKCAPNSEWRIIVTATPKTKEEDDYFGLCDYMDGGKALKVKNLTHFRAKYCKYFVMQPRGNVVYSIDKKKIKKLEKRIKHLFFSYELSDQAKIPIKVITCNASLSKKSMKKYMKLRDEQCLKSIVMKDHIIDGEVYQVKDHELSLDATVLSGKLAQLSNGFLYLDKDVRISAKLLAKTTNVKKLLKDLKQKMAVDVFSDRIDKFEWLLNKVKDRHGNVPVAIPYFFKHEKVQLLRLLPDALTDTDEDFDDKWNTGKYDHLLLQYNRSSRSLNLQDGGFILAMYSPTFLWRDDYQIVRRFARQGQKAECVYVYRLYMTGTIDDKKAKKRSQRSVGHSRFQKAIVRKIRSQQR